jgi:hypothetical protein
MLKLCTHAVASRPWMARTGVIAMTAAADPPKIFPGQNSLGIAIA